jgi:hypothetical protein
VLLKVTPGAKRIRVSVLRPGGIHCPYLSILECNPIEIVKEGAWWIDFVSIWKDSGNSELLVDHGNIDLFDLGTKLCQVNKSVSSPEENMDHRVGLPTKSSLAKLCRYIIASIHPIYTKAASNRL